MRLTPDDVGLVSSGRRNTPGLRREEVAVLAGVSASWYTWLEQGRAIGVSTSVLESISDVLRLSTAEQEHLFRLAGSTAPLFRPEYADEVDAQSLEEVVETWRSSPAYVIERHWNVRAANEVAQTVLGIDRTIGNLLVALFTDTELVARYDDWPDMARRLVGQFRAQSARFPDDDEFVAVARKLVGESETFSELWENYEVSDSAAFPVTVREPGPIVRHYEHLRLGLFGRSDLSLILYVGS